jgi:hypothetical protein
LRVYWILALLIRCVLWRLLSNKSFFLTVHCTYRDHF